MKTLLSSDNSLQPRVSGLLEKLGAAASRSNSSHLLLPDPSRKQLGYAMEAVL